MCRPDALVPREETLQKFRESKNDKKYEKFPKVEKVGFVRDSWNDRSLGTVIKISLIFIFIFDRLIGIFPENYDEI